MRPPPPLESPGPRSARLRERHEGELHLLAPGHILLRDVLIAPCDLVAQQPIVEDVGRRGPRGGFAQRHYEARDQRRAPYHPHLPLRARAQAPLLEPQGATHPPPRI